MIFPKKRAALKEVNITPTKASRKRAVVRKVQRCSPCAISELVKEEEVAFWSREDETG